MPAPFPWQGAAGWADVPVAACSRALLPSKRALSRAMLDCWLRMRARADKAIGSATTRRHCFAVALPPCRLRCDERRR